jgi:hypothetical protein
MPLTVEEWGERAFQVRDPNGVVIQLTDWNGPTATPATTVLESFALDATVDQDLLGEPPRMELGVHSEPS